MHNHMKLIFAGIDPVVFVDHHLLKAGVDVDLGFHGIYLYICIGGERNVLLIEITMNTCLPF